MDPVNDTQRNAKGRFLRGCRPGPGRPKGKPKPKATIAELAALARPQSPREAAELELAMRTELADAGHTGDDLERMVATRRRLWAKIRAAAAEQLLEQLQIRPTQPPAVEPE